MTDNKTFYCVNCGGSTASILQPHTVDRGGKLIVVREVPMHQCNDCGETYLSAEVMKSLDDLVTHLLAGVADETIVHYSAA